MSNLYLTTNEEKAIHLLADGKSLETVHYECALSLQRLYNFMATLRRKTGILNIRKAQNSRDYLAKYKKAMAGDPPTTEHLELLAIVATGKLGELGDREPAFSEACNRAGIFATYIPEIRAQCRSYLLHRKAPTDTKLTSIHKRALLLYAMGKTMREINDTLKPHKAKKLLREAMEWLGIVSRGRGVQRRLATIALERMKEQPTAVTMEDPMF